MVYGIILRLFDGKTGCGGLLIFLATVCLVVLICDYWYIFIPVLIILLVLFFRLIRVPKPQMPKLTPEEEKFQQKAKNLAAEYIKKHRHNPGEQDFIDFYEQIKESGINYENNYPTKVPYKIRCILYETYMQYFNEKNK